VCVCCGIEFKAGNLHLPELRALARSATEAGTLGPETSLRQSWPTPTHTAAHREVILSETEPARLNGRARVARKNDWSIRWRSAKNDGSIFGPHTYGHRPDARRTHFWQRDVAHRKRAAKAASIPVIFKLKHGLSVRTVRNRARLTSWLMETTYGRPHYCFFSAE